MPLIVNDVLTCAAGAAPGRLAVTLGDEAMTFGQTESLANRFSHALLALGALAILSFVRAPRPAAVREAASPVTVS